jgi:hypothetical protein
MKRSSAGLSPAEAINSAAVAAKMDTKTLGIKTSPDIFFCPAQWG